MGTAPGLPVWDTIVASYRFLSRHPRDLLRLGWLPLLIVTALNLGFGTFEPAPETDDFVTMAPLVVDALLIALLQGAVAAVMLVAWHRLAICDARPPARGDGPAALRLGRREVAYLAQMLGLSLLFLAVWIVAFLLAEIVLLGAYFIASGTSPQNVHELGGATGDITLVTLGYVAMALGLVPAFYVSQRLSLTLPETAVEIRAGEFGRSWAATRGHGWRMVAVTVLAMLPVEIVNVAFAMAAESAAGSVWHYPLAAAASVALLVTMAVLGSALTRCYLALAPAAALEATP